MTTLVGISLTGRQIVFIGAASVAARRLARFIAEGARIRLIAPELAPQTRALVDEHQVDWVPRAFEPADVADAWLVHTATGIPSVDRAVVAACERHRVFCINASDGEGGSARMTAQTTSGDVMVGVASAAGADPGRTLAVRDAIDAMLVAGRIPVRRQRSGKHGRVDLIGGGPGPIDLMTTRARRLLAEADVVIADRLGPTEEIRSQLHPGVRVIDVGKRPGHHPVPQEEINALLVEHATAGARVVRLKGGDPFVYGRGGEEVIACQRAGIPVEVTPGISSAICVPQAAGIPVTHRGTASGLHVVNGQAELSQTTLNALADPDMTTVMLMGVGSLARIVRAARAYGVRDDLPVAIIENGHTPRQRTTRSALGDVVATAADVGIQNPAVIVFGAVARADFLMPTAWRTDVVVS